MRLFRSLRVALLESVIVKPRHTAGYLLAGWYLIVPPPLSQDGRMHRLSDWAVRGSFRTEKDCDAKLAKFPKTEPSLASYPDGGLPPEEIYGKQCVASDDPRLKVVNWHLMMPHRPGDPKEPLSQWYRSDFDTEAECTELLESDRSLYLGKPPRDPAVQEQIRRLRYSQCVADSDPRLAKGRRPTFAP